jgi:hypothetical protein
MAAIYQADIWCDDCADSIRDRIWLDSRWGATYPSRKSWEKAIGFDDERMYDSDDYPKYVDDDEECDCPQHCASQVDCINAEEFADGDKVGYFFGNSLTEEGAEYVKEAVREATGAGRDHSVALDIWKPFYDWINYSDCDDE